MARILEGKHIFVVEDDLVNLSVFTVCLRESGAYVEQDVLGYGIITHILECLPVDLIVLDIMLRGGTNGYDVYDDICNHPRLKDIPVIVVTSLDPETEIPKAKAKGINGFVGKPIDIRDFPRQLAKVLDGENIWITGF